MQKNINSLENIEKVNAFSMRSIYRAQKHAGENFLPLVSLTAKAATLSVRPNEEEHVA